MQQLGENMNLTIIPSKRESHESLLVIAERRPQRFQNSHTDFYFYRWMTCGVYPDECLTKVECEFQEPKKYAETSDEEL